MGKQFQTYLMPEDAANLMEKLREKVSLGLLPRRLHQPDPIAVDSLGVRIESGGIRIDGFLIPDLSVSIKTGYVETQGYWSVDSLDSEVVEFDGGYFDGKVLRRGRLWYESGFYDKQDNWQQKSARFLDWANSLFKLTKKFLKRDPKLDVYFGQAAERWHAGGGVLLS